MITTTYWSCAALCTSAHTLKYFCALQTNNKFGAQAQCRHYVLGEEVVHSGSHVSRKAVKYLLEAAHPDISYAQMRVKSSARPERNANEQTNHAVGDGEMNVAMRKRVTAIPHRIRSDKIGQLGSPLT